jgi:hypothetical protein
MLFRTRFTDLCYGYNAFWRTVLPALDLPSTELPRRADGRKHWGDGFEIETLINIRVAACGLKITEVPSFEHDRIHGESNLNTIRDGNRVLRTIMAEFKRRDLTRSMAAENGVRPGLAPVAVSAQCIHGVRHGGLRSEGVGANHGSGQSGWLARNDSAGAHFTVPSPAPSEER